MTQSTIAQIGGKSIVSAVQWNLTSGVDPFIGEFDLAHQDAESLLQGSLSPVSLIIDSDGNGRKVFQYLYVLQKRASPNPEHSRVAVADRRWFWRHAVAYGRFNVRRRIGTHRVGAPAIAELQPVVDDFMYAPWSTRTGKGTYADRWDAEQILRRVLDQCINAEKSVSGQTPRVEVEAWGGLREIPVENLEIDGAASDALRRALAYVPEAEVTVGADGTVRVYNRTVGVESGYLRSIVEVQDKGHLERVDLRRVRPRKIHVLFDRECELRLDSLASGETSTQDQRTMTNVLPIPDYSLTVDGEDLTQGTWITFDQAFDAWGSLPRVGVALSDAICRQAFIPDINLMSMIGEIGKRAPDADWVSRVAAVSMHWRQTYRVNRRWMDRIRAIHANRVALVDPATGQRAMAQAWTNYCVISSQRMLYLSQQGGSSGLELPYAANVVGYPNSGFSTDLPAAPFGVTVLDEEQGIIRIDHITDPLRLREIVLPGMMELYGDGTGIASQPSSPGPSADIKDQDRYPISFDLLTSSMRAPALTASHKVATIVTALMGAPNGKTQLSRITISPADVYDMVPTDVRRFLSQCDGPELEVRIGPAIETAKVAWFDSKADLIEQAFGIDVPEDSADQYVDLSDITVNQVSDEGGASLWNIAKAQAASIWAALGDRAQGSAVGGFAPEVRVGGYASEIGFNVSRKGAVTTSVTLPEQVEPLDLAAYLDANTFRIVKRMIGPGNRGG